MDPFYIISSLHYHIRGEVSLLLFIGTRQQNMCKTKEDGQMVLSYFRFGFTAFSMFFSDNNQEHAHTDRVISLFTFRAPLLCHIRSLINIISIIREIFLFRVRDVNEENKIKTKINVASFACLVSCLKHNIVLMALFNVYNRIL